TGRRPVHVRGRHRPPPVAAMSPRCRGDAMIRAKRATSRTFVVRFPWNACYCGRLRWALERLGLATMKDPFEDGSDNAALFVATGSRTLAGRTMIRAYGAELEAGASFDDVEARLAASPGRRARDHPRLEMAGLGGRCVDAA